MKVKHLLPMIHHNEKIDIFDNNDNLIATYFLVKDNEKFKPKVETEKDISDDELLNRTVVEIGTYDICDMSGATAWVATVE